MHCVITVATLIVMHVSVIVLALVHPTRAQSVPQKNVCSWYVVDAVQQLQQLKAWHAEDLISADVLKERQQKALDSIHRAPEGPLPDPNKAATQEEIATSCATSPIGLPTPEQWEQAQADLALLQQTAKNNYVELAECTLNTTKLELVVCERLFEHCNDPGLKNYNARTPARIPPGVIEEASWVTQEESNTSSVEGKPRIVAKVPPVPLRHLPTGCIPPLRLCEATPTRRTGRHRPRKVYGWHTSVRRPTTLRTRRRGGWAG
jgi:hypothetical protein